MAGTALQVDSLGRLRHSWWFVAFLAILALLGGFLFLRYAWSPAAAFRWAILAGLVLILQFAFLWRGLPQNHPQGEDVIWPGLGPANTLTIARGMSAAALAGLLALSPPPANLIWLPVILHAASVFPDLLDGYIARITGRVSVLGGRLDMEFDSIAMLAATLLAVNYAYMPWWFAMVGLSRYLYVVALWLRSRRNLPIGELPPSGMRRVIAGLMMSLANLALWPILDHRIMALSGFILAVPHLAGFTRDWLVVTGRVDPSGPGYMRLFAFFDRGLGLLLPALRILGCTAALAFLVPATLRMQLGPAALLASSLPLLPRSCSPWRARDRDHILIARRRSGSDPTRPPVVSRGAGSRRAAGADLRPRSLGVVAA
jgi:CDP-diacylglycerol--glycerol-3-phosphate 3-phosphatidyltransferase